MNIDAMRAAAENGDPRAQTAIGYLYDVGNQVSQDPKMAASWYRKAAKTAMPLGSSIWRKCFVTGQA